MSLDDRLRSSTTLHENVAPGQYRI